MSALLEAQIPKFTALSRFPGVRRDIAVIVDQEVPVSEIVDLMEVKPTLMQRNKIIPRITEKMKEFVDVFYSGF